MDNSELMIQLIEARMAVVAHFCDSHYKIATILRKLASKWLRLVCAQNSRADATFQRARRATVRVVGRYTHAPVQPMNPALTTGHRSHSSPAQRSPVHLVMRLVCALSTKISRGCKGCMRVYARMEARYKITAAESAI